LLRAWAGQRVSDPREPGFRRGDPMRITAIALAALLLLANVRCLGACETAPQKPRVASSCHQREQPEPDPVPQSCMAVAAVKAVQVESGVIAHAAARNVA